MIPSAEARQLSDAQCITYKASPTPRRARSRGTTSRPCGSILGRWATAPVAAAAAIAGGGIVTVPVAFHVLRKDTTIAGGNAPLAWIEAQIDVLNESYSGATGGADTGFRFELASVDRTTKSSWFKFFYAQGGEPRFFRGSHKEIQVKKALYEGGPETLNVYTGALGKFLLGWAYYPSDFVGDGALPAVLGRRRDRLPLDAGRRLRPLRRGRHLTHEVGHWLELLHTFENGCAGRVTSIADTPYEASPAFGCPEDRDTCAEAGLTIPPRTSWTTPTTRACSSSPPTRPTACRWRGSSTEPDLGVRKEGLGLAAQPFALHSVGVVPPPWRLRPVDQAGTRTAVVWVGSSAGHPACGREMVPGPRGTAQQPITSRVSSCSCKLDHLLPLVLTTWCRRPRRMATRNCAVLRFVESSSEETLRFRRRRMRLRTRIAGIAVVAALALAPATAANAAFPGGNGDIAFGRSSQGQVNKVVVSRRDQHDAAD